LTFADARRSIGAVPITFIWFDLGYTLLHRAFAQPYQGVLAELGLEVPLERLEREYHLADKLFMREYPGVFGRDPDTYSPWFLGVLNHALGIRTDLCRTWQRLKQALAADSAGWMPIDGAAEALADLGRRGYRLGVITNWDPSARTLLARHGLDVCFEKVVVSSEAGCEKPDRRIFDLAAAAAGVQPAECLYVGDDYYVDTVGARGAGMESLIVNRYGSLGVEEITDAPIVAHVGEVAGWLESRRG
jgi:putative hydrolase of the HAD superfamily